MTAVREKLTDFAKALNTVEELYEALTVPQSAAAAEASTRLYVAEEAQGVPLDALHVSLETATNIVRRALADMPKEQRRYRVDGPSIVRLILMALTLGHSEHFDCAGYGDTPSKETILPFGIRVTREPTSLFHRIASIMSTATQRLVDETKRERYQVQGAALPPPDSEEAEAWNPDWVIRQYLELQATEKKREREAELAETLKAAAQEETTPKADAGEQVPPKI
jgi:hypothetical protein